MSLPICFRTLHKNGSYIWLEGTITNMLHEEPIQALVLNFKDITSRKEVEDKLIQSERIYNTIASSIPGSVICILDLDLTYLQIEGDLYAKWGFSKEMLINKKVKDLFPYEVFLEWEADCKKVLNGEQLSKETTNQGLDILTRFVALKNENEEIYAVMIVSIDITELKQAQTQILNL